MKKESLIRKCIKHIGWLIISLRGYFLFRNTVDESTYIFISHNGDSAGGAPIVLFELMKTLKDKKKIVFLCWKPGEIMNLCADEKIPSYCTYLVQKLYLKRIKKKNVEIVIVNTLVMHKCINFFNQKKCNTQVLWWVHEENNLIINYGKHVPKEIQDNIHLLCVSSSVNENLLKVAPQCSGRTKIFYYGCKDLLTDQKSKESNDSQFVISVIGRICERKNQIQVIEAYNMLPSELKNEILVDFIAASADDEYKKELLQSIKKCSNSNIRFVGSVKRGKMVQVYEKSDLIICPSIDDPLPVVITEAMMLKTLFITSSKTGQYDLVEDGINGFTYDVNSNKDLCNKIVMAYENRNHKIITNKARETYLKNFAPDVVREHFMDIIFEIKHR